MVSEALTNALKHAADGRVEVRLCLAGGLRVEVTDDGVGGASMGPASGLGGLNDRVRAIGGELYVHSEPGLGTTVVAELPRKRRSLVAGTDATVKVVLADDALLGREALADLLTRHRFGVLAQVGDAQSLRHAVDRHRPHVAIIDVRMPPDHRLAGLQAATEIRRDHPEIGVLVLSQHIESHYLPALLGGRSRGVGYLLKERVPGIDAFIDAVRRVAAGDCAIDPAVVTRLMNA